MSADLVSVPWSAPAFTLSSESRATGEGSNNGPFSKLRTTGSAVLRSAQFKLDPSPPPPADEDIKLRLAGGPPRLGWKLWSEAGVKLEWKLNSEGRTAGTSTHLQNFSQAFQTPPPPSFCHAVTPARNLALGRCARQSSIFPYEIIGKACKAVNGNCDGDFEQASCTHTNLDMEPWWYVDLGDQFFISTVVVKNREDCCSERLKGAEIQVGNSLANHGKSNPVCGRIANPSPGSISTIHCNGQEGRYVSISIPGRAEYLTLCEVEVYGSK
ncbi:fucolectin-4-like [Tiliqua scincoides]|uniref:fucolectin-4-like n=1 Tax=Tiliqua scincoides TaxID=71010 RepID=UPI00346236F1